MVVKVVVIEVVVIDVVVVKFAIVEVEFVKIVVGFCPVWNHFKSIVYFL